MLKVYLVYGKVMNTLWHNLMHWGKYKKTIWSHCKILSYYGENKYLQYLTQK